MTTPNGVRAWLRTRRTSALLRGSLATLVVSVLASSATVVIESTTATAADPCIGNCDGDHSVSNEELRLGVEIALERAIGPCVYDLPVAIDQLVQAARSHQNGCPGPAVPLVVSGRCRRPGPTGLLACDAGFLVEALRCDDRPTCAEPSSTKTMLGSGPIGSMGAFSFVIDQLDLGSSTMLVQAEAALQPATIYRILDIGPLGTGGGAGIAEVILEIDPSSEGAVRALGLEGGPLGLDAFSNDDIQRLIVSTRASAGEFAGRTAEEAARDAQEVAQALSAPRIVSFVSEPQSFAYHALSSGAFAHRFTTLSLSPSPSAADTACAVSSDVLTAGTVTLVAPETNIVTKSAILPGDHLVFNAQGEMGVGRVCVGASCLANATCPSGTNDCHFFAYNQNSMPLVQGTFDVPDGVRVFVHRDSPCSLDGFAFAFGTSQPTIEAELGGPSPADGFTLPPNTTIFFSEPIQPGGGYVFGCGGYRLRNDAGVITLTGAAADIDSVDLPPNTQ